MALSPFSMHKARQRALDAALEAKRGLDATRWVVTVGVFIGQLARVWNETLTGARLALCLGVPFFSLLVMSSAQAIWARRAARRIETYWPLPPLPKLHLGDDDENDE